MSGPSEAWFLSAYDSFAALEKADTSVEANPALLDQRAVPLPDPERIAAAAALHRVEHPQHPVDKGLVDLASRILAGRLSRRTDR